MGIYSFAEMDFGQYSKNSDLEFAFTDILRAYPRFMAALPNMEDGHEQLRTAGEIFQILENEVENMKSLEDIINLTIDCCASYDAFSKLRTGNEAGQKLLIENFGFFDELKEWLLLRYLYNEENEKNGTFTYKSILKASGRTDKELKYIESAFTKMRSNCRARIAELIRDVETINKIKKPRKNVDKRKKSKLDKFKYTEDEIQKMFRYKKYLDVRQDFFEFFGGMVYADKPNTNSYRERERSIRYRSKYDVPLAALFFGNKIMLEESEDEVCILGKKHIRTLDLRKLLRKEIVENYIEPFVDTRDSTVSATDKAIISYLVERVTLHDYIEAVSKHFPDGYDAFESYVLQGMKPTLEYLLESGEPVDNLEAFFASNYKKKPWLLAIYLLALHPLIGFRAKVAQNIDFFRKVSSPLIHSKTLPRIVISYGEFCGLLAHQIYLYFPLVTAVFDFLVKLWKKKIKEGKKNLDLRAIDEAVLELKILRGKDSFVNMDDDTSKSKKEGTSESKEIKCDFAQEISLNFLRLLVSLKAEKVPYLIKLIGTDFKKNDGKTFPEVWSFINQNFEEFKDLYGIARNDNRPTYYIEKVDNVHMSPCPQKKGCVD